MVFISIEADIAKALASKGANRLSCFMPNSSQAAIDELRKPLGEKHGVLCHAKQTNLT
jgi:hypothetical protein